jgi:rubredoxin
MTEASTNSPLYVCLICGRNRFEPSPDRMHCPTCNTERIRPMTNDDLNSSEGKGLLRRLLGR